MKRCAAVGLVLLVTTAVADLAGPAVAATRARPARAAADRGPAVFAVGTTTLDFGQGGRELRVDAWYPAKGRATPIPVVDAAPARRWAPYPLVVFNTELGTDPHRYAALLRGWASRGYVVVVPRYAPPGDTDVDETGSVVVDLGERLLDVSFVVDRMSDRAGGRIPRIVDGRRVAAAGHALGAITTYLAVFGTNTSDDRFDAAVTLAGGLAGDPADYFTGPETPWLAIHGEADPHDPIEATAEAYALARPPKFFVSLVDGDHITPFTEPSDPAFRVVRATTLDFFAAYLKGRRSGLEQLLRDGKAQGVARLTSALPD